jgi:hypothetical protein
MALVLDSILGPPSKPGAPEATYFTTCTYINGFFMAWFQGYHFAGFGGPLSKPLKDVIQALSLEALKGKGAVRAAPSLRGGLKGILPMSLLRVRLTSYALII